LPEGDSIRKVQAWLGPKITGRTIASARSRWPSAAFGLVGKRVERVEAVGKNLWIVLDDRTAVRVHLGMKGKWRWNEEAHRGSLGDVSLELGFDVGYALCLRAPTVQRLPVKVLDAPRDPEKPAFHPVRELGPDVLADDFDVEAVLPRIPSSPAGDLGELLLDQRVACGIGNVYKSEVLFACGLYPFDPPQILDDDTWRKVYAKAREMMLANVRPGPRITTPRRVAERHWVYGRAGRPCFVCGSIVETRTASSGGGPPRSTFWCPTCNRSRRGP
jgi:endonuclease-8